MRKIFLSVVLATTLTLTSCQFDDSDIWGKLDEYGESIRDHEQRISALEELCKQMNTNIEALQILVNALEKRDYVTNVSEVRSNGEVIGYTISFAYSDTITIYHGKDGANGADGKDGYTPQISVMKDTDGIYYWTLDGEWLLDGKGNKIQANGVNGTDGTNGSNGANGTNGVTPQLKIENDYWYVSYDNGATWEKLGKATGEDGKDGQDGNDGADGSDGADGEDGKDGDNIFKSVTQDDEYVYFNLADGTMITLPKHAKENIQFEDLQVKAICCKNWDTNNDGELSYAEAAAVTDIGDVFNKNTNILDFSEFRYFVGVTEIDDYAFACYDGDNLNHIVTPSLWRVVMPDNISSIGISAFFGCCNLTYLTIGKGVLSIKDTAFMDCYSLKSVSISNNVTHIGYAAFFGCTSLTSITIPDSVTEIGREAFRSCHNIDSVIIGKGITSIGYQAFDLSGTNAITVYCKAIYPPTKIGDTYNGWEAFGTNISNLKIYVPRVSVEAYKRAWSEYATIIEPYDFE